MPLAELKFSGASVWEITLVAGIAVLLIVSSYTIYNAYFHRLSKFPGPAWAGALPIWAIRAWLSGRYVHAIDEMHKKHGPVVRISPNQLSFNSATSFKDIYSHVPGRKSFLKSDYYEPMPGQMRTLVSATDPSDHAAMRKTMSHGFSASALAAQEDRVHDYVDQLVLQVHASAGDTMDMVQWYNWTAFDIIGELAFGASFGAVETGKSHPWIDTFLGSARALAFLRVFEFFSPLRSLFRTLYKNKLLPRRIVSPGGRQAQYGRDMLQKRLHSESARVDFMTKMISEREKNGSPSFQELTAQAGMLVRAGSETTSTALSGITYYLGGNRQVYDKLVREIRQRFHSAEEINGKSTDALVYLKAVIEEGLRLFPPIAVGLPRVSPGETVDGYFIPKGAIVYTSGFAATHSESNFRNASSFIPERWIEVDCPDKKTASQPFSLGSRGCLGRNLALMDMRLILAKILWSFDFNLVDDGRDWMAENKSLVIWQKGALNVQFLPRSAT